jgi:hypothetical protein
MSEVGFEPTIFRPTSAELEPAPLSQFGYSLEVGSVGFEPTFPAPSGLTGPKPAVLNRFTTSLHSPKFGARKWTELRQSVREI